MSEEIYQYFEDLIYLNVPRSISNFMKRLQAQQQLLRKKPTSYHKRHVETLRVVVTEAAETDKLLYQDLMPTRDTQLVFRHLKSFNKSCSLPKLLVFKSKTSKNDYDKVSMLNGFF